MIALVSLQRISVTILLFLPVVPLSGENPFRLSYGAMEAGMGKVCMTLPGFYQSFHNQALLAYNDGLYIGVGHENRFNIKELGTTTAGILVPLSNKSIGVCCSRFGNRDFSRVISAIAVGTELSENFALGVQINYLHESSYVDYGDTDLITIEIGSLVYLTDKTTIAFHLYNPVPNSIRKTELSSSISMGIGSMLNETVFIAFEALMDLNDKPVIKTGFEYEPVKNLELRGGFASENNSFSFGVGYQTRPFKIDFAFLGHESLGITSMISLLFQLR